MIQDAGDKPKTGIISSVIGFIVLLFGAGGVVGQLQTSLNKIWKVTPKPGQGILGFVRQRFFSFAMVLAIGFLLLVSLVVSAVLASLTGMLSGLFGEATVIAHIVDTIVSFGFISLLFARWASEHDQGWAILFYGAGVFSVSRAVSIT